MLGIYGLALGFSIAPCNSVAGALSGAAAEEASLPPGIAAALTASGLPASALHLYLLAPDHRLLFQHQAQEAVPPGSLIKLVLTLAALEQLGPAFRFSTDLLADPVAAGYRSGTPGDAGSSRANHPRAPAGTPVPRGWQLAWRGGGDPDLRQEDLRLMLREAEARGMTRLAGPVLLDGSRFARVTELGSGIRAEPARPWAALPAALQVDHAAVHVWLPAEAPRAWLSDPPFAGSVQWQPVPGPCPPDWTAALQLEVRPAALSRPSPPGSAGRLLLRGPRAPDCPAAELWRSPLPALDHFGWTVTALWRGLGHPESVAAVPGAAPSYATISIRHLSRPLAELVRDTNKFSNNLMARTLLLDLAAEAGDLPATPAGGAAVLQAWLRSRHLDFPELAVENGAGLSHGELLTAEHLGQLLQYAVTSPVAPEFLASLPIPGQDGTLAKRFLADPLAARMRLKTGSLDGVRGLAGLVAHPAGGYGVVVCVVNAPQVGDVSALQQAVLDYLAAHW